MDWRSKAVSETDLWNILDNMHNEIIIYDKALRLIYVNNAAERHYGKQVQELIGTPYPELRETYFGNDTLPEVFRTKKTVTKQQITNLGLDVVTTSVPILDENGEIQFVVQNVNDVYVSPDAEQTGFLESLEEDLNDSEAGSFIYANPSMHKIFQMINKLKNLQAPCLITGETGTGKTLLGRHIHMLSDRRDRPFVYLHCSYSSPEIMDLELFGSAPNREYPQGKKGLVAKADTGILFLDGISDFPLKLQGKLLRLLQEQEYFPIGSKTVEKVNVKIIAATNRNLQQMMKFGTLQADMYYRLNVFELALPPLRARPDDIDVLLQHYLRYYNKRHNRQCFLSVEAKTALLQYSWPGNVRELRHIVERLVLMSTSGFIVVSDLPKTVFDSVSQIKDPAISKNYEGRTLDDILTEVERDVILEAFKSEVSSVNVAKALGLSQSKAYRLIQKYTR